MSTPKLNLPKISGNMTADVVRDLNALADAVDANAAKATELASHKALNATTAQSGHVQLTSSTASTSTTLAPTASALKSVKDLADGKSTVVNSATNGNIKINGVETSVYNHPTGAGNNHIPSGGATGQVLGYGGSSGVASWQTIPVPSQDFVKLIEHKIASDTAEVTISNVGMENYKRLKIIIIGYSTSGSGDGSYVFLRNLNSVLYKRVERFYSTSYSRSGTSNTTGAWNLGCLYASESTPLSAIEVDIYHGNESNAMIISQDYHSQNSKQVTENFITVPITFNTLTFYRSAGSYVSGTIFKIYGCR